MIAIRIDTPAVVQRAATGCDRAWQLLFDEFQHRVFGFVYAECRCRALAEEITQLTFVKAFEALPAYRERGCFIGWLIRIAANGLRDELRRSAARPVVMDLHGWQAKALCEQGRMQFRSGCDKAAAPEHAALAREWREVIAQWCARLNPAEQEVIVRRYWQGQSSSEIADQIGVPLGTVLSRAHRALEKLRGFARRP